MDNNSGANDRCQITCTYMSTDNNAERLLGGAAQAFYENADITVPIPGPEGTMGTDYEAFSAEEIYAMISPPQADGSIIRTFSVPETRGTQFQRFLDRHLQGLNVVIKFDCSNEA